MTEYLDKAGIHYAYLPPYSPDLNPIEKMWSKMKAILRKQKVRVASELPEAVKKALEMIRHRIVRGGSMRVDICTNLWKCYNFPAQSLHFHFGSVAPCPTLKPNVTISVPRTRYRRMARPYLIGFSYCMIISLPRLTKFLPLARGNQLC